MLFYQFLHCYLTAIPHPYNRSCGISYRRCFYMKLKLKDPGSAITHGIAISLQWPELLRWSWKLPEAQISFTFFAVSVFILTMILLYLASTLYHSVNSTAKVNRRLKKWITWWSSWWSQAAIHRYAWSSSTAAPVTSSVHWYGLLPSSAWSSKAAGSTARNGFPP